MSVNYNTITLEVAKRAVEAYNGGSYTGGIKNLDLDRQGLHLFRSGLGLSFEDIHKQVRFIGVDYGGAAGFRSAWSLAPAIARDIHSVRDRYSQLVQEAPALSGGPSPIELISELYRPFVKPLHGNSNWQVWAVKFWHFLNSDAFLIEDSRVDKFFVLARPNSPEKYVSLLHRFRDFTREHQSWLSVLRRTDGGNAWCDNKLWDKVCYGVYEIH